MAQHLQNYLAQLSAAWGQQHSDAVAKLLQLDLATHPGADALVAFVDTIDIAGACHSAGLVDDVADIAVNHLMALAARRQARTRAAAVER